MPATQPINATRQADQSGLNQKQIADLSTSMPNDAEQTDLVCCSRMFIVMVLTMPNAANNKIRVPAITSKLLDNQTECDPTRLSFRQMIRV